MLYYGDQVNDWRAEVRRLRQVNVRRELRIEKLEETIRSLKARIRELTQRKELLAAEQSAEILECKPFEVKYLAFRHGLTATQIGNRLFFHRQDIEQLRDKRMQARG